MSHHALRTDRTVGILLVLAGGVLFLYSLGVFSVHILSGTVWIGLTIAGLVIAVNGWRHRSSVLLFLGGFLFVAGVHTSLWSFHILEPGMDELIPAALLWIGLASVFVWLPAPYKIDLLVPAFLFGGSGLGYYLWWWDVLPMRELKELYADSWPVLLILIGLGVLFRSFKRM